MKHMPDHVDSRLISLRAWRWLVTGMTLIVGLLYGLPHLLWLHDQHWDVKNTLFIASFAQGWDEHHYIAQMKEVAEGNYWLSNTYLAEYKNTVRPIWLVLTIYCSGIVAKLVHIDVQHLAALMDFLCPPLIFLLAYWLLNSISQARRAALLGALVLTLTPRVLTVDFWPAFLARFTRLQGLVPPLLADMHCYNCFSRTISPQLNFIVVLVMLYFFCRAITTQKLRDLIWCAVFGLCTTFSYPFFAAYANVFLGLWVLVSVALKERALMRTALTLLGGQSVFLGLFLAWMLSFQDASLNQAHVMLRSHQPILNAQVWLSVGIAVLSLLLVLLKVIRKIPGSAACILSGSGVICLNQHVVTGIFLQQNHYLLYVIPQFTLLAVTLLLVELLRFWQSQPRVARLRLPRLRVATWGLYGGLVILGVSAVVFRPSVIASTLSADGVLVPKVRLLLHVAHWGGIVVGGLLSVIGGFLQWQRRSTLSVSLGSLMYAAVVCYWLADISIVQYERYQVYMKPNFGYLQNLFPAARWLDEHTPPESVVLGCLDYAATDALISTVTDNNLYMTAHAQYYSVPSREELLDRLYTVMSFFGVGSQAEFDAWTKDESISGPFFLGYLNPSYADYQQKLRLNIYAELKKYRIDYVFYGPRERKYLHVDAEQRYPFLKAIYTDPVVTIYQVQ